MMSQSTKPVLGYWKIRGLVQPVRLLLEYLGIEFEDKFYELTEQLTKDNWYAVKHTLELDFPNLPYLIDGSTRITESRAIMKHLCRTRKPELLGKTNDVQTRLDVVDNFIYDLLQCEFIPVLYHYTEEKDKEYKELEPVKLGYLSAFMGNNEWVTGNDITYLDFYVYEVLYQLRVFNKNCLDKFPNLQEFLSRFENIPSMKAYMSSPNYIKAPLYNKNAIIKI